MTHFTDLNRTKCYNRFRENLTIFVDNCDTIVLNCTCFSEDKSAWSGPSGLQVMVNDTTLTGYANGLEINPNLPITNVVIYGNYTIGMCHLKISNFSTANNGIYECSYIHSDILHIQRFNVFSKKPPTNLKIVKTSGNNIIYGKEGVRIELKCTVKNGIPAATLIWSKEDLTVSNGSSDTLLYQFTPTRFDHMQNITCYINSDLLTSPLSETIKLDIQYRPHLTIIRSRYGSIIEGESVKLCCFSNSNPLVQYLAWYQNNYEVFSWKQSPKSEGLNKDLCLPIYTVYRNHTGNYTCFAENSIAKSNSIIAINVLYPPDVKVTYTISEQSIILHCIPNGNPENYIFYDWQHKSEFNEHIRYIHGTPEGQLIIQTHQSRKTNEVDGIYVCNVSNGVSNRKGQFNQEGQTLIKSHASPVFVSENKPIQVGTFGSGVEIKVTIYDKLYNSTVFIRNNGTTLEVKPTIENITTHDTLYGVNVRVTGIQYIFQLYLTSTNNFTNYTVEACNDVGCNYFYVKVISPDFNNKPQKYCNSGWKIMGILFGGILIISICLNIYCLLKRKSLSRMVPEIPHEMQYDEIGNINDNQASILALSNSVHQAVTSVDGPYVEEADSHLTPLEHNDSSDNSVQSLSTSLLCWDGYEHPYQSIDPADIEIHPYRTIGSYLYQNTTIFPRRRSSRNPNPFIPNEEKRVPWLVIYKKTCVNAWT
ncbi:hemicentin-1-like [Mytilus trossulus]|uniref:hemicentin-1-like n=1 Tax=Mytilus trossulus TaxID=6551 RepID=UPI003006CAAC